MAISRERERESSSAMLYYRIYTPQKMGYIFKHIREELLPLEAVYIFDRYGVINNRVFVLLQRSGFLSASFSFLRLLFPLCTRDALFAKFFFPTLLTLAATLGSS